MRTEVISDVHCTAMFRCTALLYLGHHRDRTWWTWDSTALREWVCTFGLWSEDIYIAWRICLWRTTHDSCFTRLCTHLTWTSRENATFPSVLLVSSKRFTPYSLESGPSGIRLSNLHAMVLAIISRTWTSSSMRRGKEKALVRKHHRYECSPWGHDARAFDWVGLHKFTFKLLARWFPFTKSFGSEECWRTWRHLLPMSEQCCFFGCQPVIYSASMDLYSRQLHVSLSRF